MKKMLLLGIACLAQAAPPTKIPADLYNDFTLNGAMGVTEWYRDDSYAPEQALIYTKEAVDQNLVAIAQRKVSYYGQTDSWLYDAIEKYIYEVRNKIIGIIGSTVPWYESVALYYGAYPVTVEYNTIVSEDTRLKVMTVADYERSPIAFDVLFSISTYEHDGLGRYGDPVDPYGDLKAMQKARSMLKDDGLLFLSVPVGQDHIFWNVHRVYGRVRLPLLLEGWEIIDSFGFDSNQFDKHSRDVHQPVFVLRKK